MTDKKYDVTNRGSLFTNANKTTDKHPDYSGSLNFVCPHCKSSVDTYISAWNNTAPSGKQYMSVSVKPKTDTPAVLARPAAAKALRNIAVNRMASP